MKTKEKNAALLTGAPGVTLFRFALPIILGNFFQQLYNVVDAMVIGNFLGDLPLAGISVASPAMDILNALIIGGSMGVGVLISRLCGGQNWEELKRVLATALIGGTVISLCLALLGNIGMEPLLKALGTQEDVCAVAMSYLRIVLIGLIPNFLYNYFAAVLRAYGDSQTPFKVLLVSSVLHAVLDLLLVGGFNLGVRGVAISTVFCQLFSAVWCGLYAHTHYDRLRLMPRDLRVDIRAGTLAFSFAWAAALQQTVVSLGRFLVQGSLTSLGQVTVTGYNMGVRTEAFLFCITQGLGAAMVVCLSQNLGSGNCKRVFSFAKAGIAWNLVFGAGVGLLCYTLPERMIGLFSGNASVIGIGAEYLRTMSFLYILAFLNETIQCLLRGMGKLRLTIMTSIFQIVMRTVLAYLLVPRLGLQGVCISVFVGWTILASFGGSVSWIAFARYRKSFASNIEKES